MNILPSHLVPERAGVVGFLSSQQRAGDWLLPRQFRAVSAMASVVIDLTRARVGAGTSTIDVRCIMGNIEILVPPHMRVECRGSGLLGNFEHKVKGQQVLPLDAPTIIVDGVAFMGNVEVRIVDPNAPGFVDRLLARIGG
ncbi:MAG TPA: LiaF domain-containing protein [Gemmatimonadaceae bacterium]|nr:LiaF domain-containing protein [Gemmatimonadaceae bacterium]